MAFESGESMQLLGKSPAICRLREQIHKVAAMDVVVLVQGESGTGKELVARAIHDQSRRSRKAFVAINCGAIPESLTESILFGYEGGAFSGASSAGQVGLLEKASGGTLFLDEAGEMPPSLQAKMLRTLQNHKIRRVGGSQVCQLDMRIIAASNRNLREEVRLGRFREDLFYRLDVIPLFVPPLRERPEDIRLLADFFLNAHSAAQGIRYEISSGLLRKFESYAWPGNVRELKNFVEYGVCFSENGRLTRKLLEPRFALSGVLDKVPNGVRRRKSAFDVACMESLLQRYGSDMEGKKAVAHWMGISLATLYRYLKRERG
ncbi:AAA family ATPase [Desulfovibrio sp. OH1186_COT-070]|nr:AAA family ATPase [Desulfovibrio sp. OH1209_COT-279]RRD87099.1 AAA family ATPase [Desulfovibrio sp. OH1186_COT-070]